MINKICFDTIKIRTDKKYFIKEIQKFDIHYGQNNEITGINYNSKNKLPFNLFIGISNKYHSLTIEFSSKILLKDYPKLISRETMRICLENIQKLHICELDVDGILSDYIFSKVDITKDIDFELTEQALNYLNSFVGNYHRYSWGHYIKEGILFNKEVKEPSCKISLKIYNKEKEITTNKDFLKYLGQIYTKSIKEYFKGKIRIEMQLRNMNAIKKFFNISSTKSDYLFDSNINPLLKQFNKIFPPEKPLQPIPSSKQEADAMQYLKSFDNDLKRIKQYFKNHSIYNSRSGLAKRMKSIEAVKKKLYIESNGINYADIIRDKIANN